MELTEKNHIRQNYIKNTLIAMALFAIFMALYLLILKYPIFSDEADVFEKGYLINRGGELYKDLISQHMPISYYIAAVISWFGPTSAFQYRLGFYILMSIFYILVYFRHHKIISPVVLIITPVFFLLQLPYQSYGFAIISDHWQGFGIAIILLELIRYLKTKEITIAMSVWISIAIQLSFGCAFLAAYAILPIIITVAVIQLHDYIKTPKEERKVARKKLLHEDLTLIGIVLLPMFILLLFYAITGNLGNFIEGAYTLNREVYPRYIGGYGSSAFGAIKTTFDNFITTYKRIIQAFANRELAFPQDLSLLLMLVSNIAVSIWLGIKKHPAAGIGWFLACFFCGVRGFDSFHGMPYFFVSALSFALVFSWCIHRLLNKRDYITGAVAITIASFVAAGFPGLYQDGINSIHLLKTEPNETKIFLDTILGEEDKIHITNVTQMTYSIDYQRKQDYGSAISTPWTYEVYGERELQAIKDNQTKVIFYTPGFELWERKADEYGAGVADYIKENYTRYRDTEMWIRNDYWDQAMLSRDYPQYRISQFTGDGTSLSEMMLPGGSITQTFIPREKGCSAVLLKTSCEDYRNPAGMTLEITEKESGLSQGSIHIDRTEIMNKGWTVFPIHTSLETGKEYLLRFSADPCEGETGISPYITATEKEIKQAGESTYCIAIASEERSYEPLPVALSNGDATEFVNIGTNGSCDEYLIPDRNMTIKGVLVQIGKYNDTANGVVGIRISDTETGRILGESTTDITGLPDSQYSNIFSGSVDLERGRPYQISIYMADPAKGIPAIGAAKDSSDKENDTAYAYYPDAEGSWDYCMKLLPVT